jgi:DNA-binding XRE family transcriptional regulator
MPMKTRKYDPISKEFQELRRKRGETQGEFAAHFGVERTTMLNWETYGPPAYGPTRRYAELRLKELKAEKYHKPQPRKKRKRKAKPKGMYALALRSAKRRKLRQELEKEWIHD